MWASHKLPLGVRDSKNKLAYLCYEQEDVDWTDLMLAAFWDWHVVEYTYSGMSTVTDA